MEDYNAINSFPRPSMPDGFRTLLFSLSKEVLREQPIDLYEFCADFFGRRLLNRGDSWITFKERYNLRKKERAKAESKLKTMPDPVTENTTDLPVLEDFTPEEEQAVVKIQAGVRGMLSRRQSGMRTDGSAQQAERERWLNPRQQLQRDLSTVSDSISFAHLQSHDGVWEECQRWLHPAQQLQRDYETSAEPVECAHVRDRGPSLEDATAAAEASAELERSRGRSSPAEAVSPQHSDVDVAGLADGAPEAGRAGSPAEVASPAHSALSVAGAAGATSPTRGPSIASVRSARHSDVSLADQAPPAAFSPDARARSLEAVDTEHVVPPIRPTSAPPPPTDVLSGPTASSQLDLAGEESAAGEAAVRAGSPQEVASPAHSDVEVAAGRQSPLAEPPRAGSPSEALTPAHSDVDMAGAAPPGPQAERAGSPAEAASPAHSDVELAGADAANTAPNPTQPEDN